MVGVTTRWGTVLKGLSVREVEKHCSVKGFHQKIIEGLEDVSVGKVPV